MPAAAKRKRTVKRKTTTKKGGSMSKKARLDLNERQYYQDISHSELGSWFGCGSYLFGTPELDFQSPMDGLMWFEIMSGTGDPGTGGLRLCASYEDPDDYDTSTFMVPFQNVEQFIIIDEPSPKNSKSSSEPAYRAIIVPTAAVGASALKKTYPKIISFTLPERKAGKDFKGKIGEAADNPDETYRSLVTKVFNEQLAPFQKSVVDASSAAAVEEPDARLACDVVFERDGSSSEKPVQGKLFFLEAGILFHSEAMVLYLTAESTPKTILVSNYEVLSKSPGPVNLTFVCSTSEPYYDKGRGSQQSTSQQHETPETMFTSFHDIHLEMSGRIIKYAKQHGVKLKEVEQEWYDLKEDQPASGWIPPGMMSGREWRGLGRH